MRMTVAKQRLRGRRACERQNPEGEERPTNDNRADANNPPKHELPNV